ncbi:hypothetical protein ACJIZ3_023935 [Penstemon smallii]|uniref:RRM domain-containing protein n=1 Tax=Penstemon smallii TaxID=265156 RepID=A0ABD3TQF6_9LAMI
MSACSLSMAACSQFSISSTRLHDSPLPLRFFPCKSKPILKPFSKLKACFNHTPSSIRCVSLENVEFNQETVSQVNDVSQSAEGERLYVGNLPFSITSSQLSEIFAEAGRVVSVEIVYSKVTDRSRGFAFVTMGSVEEAKEAIRLFDGSQIGGRSVKVNFPEVPKGGEREVTIKSGNQGFVDSPYKIYASNLSWGLTSQGLKQAFAEQPGFLSAKVILDKDSGRSQGYGFITFESAQDLEFALRTMNGVALEGRPVKLHLAEQKGRVSSLSAVRNTSENDLISSVGI